MAINTNEIRQAFTITTTHEGLDLPDIGMTNGVIRFITGKTNTGLTFESGEPAEDFNTGFLIESPFRGTGSKIDIATGGNYNSNNTYTVTIDNTRKFANNLLSFGIYIINDKVQAYEVIDGILYPTSGGVMGDFRYNEKNAVFECKDVNEDVFKQMPDSDDSQITIGNIPYGKLKKASDGDDISIYTFYATEYTQVERDGLFVPKLTLNISLDFYKKYGNAPDLLVGRYAKARNAADDNGDSFSDAITIIGSDAAVYDDTKAEINIYLENPLDKVLSQNMLGSDAFTDDTLPYSPTLFNLSSKIPKVVIDILDMKTKYYISEGDIGGLELDVEGQPQIYTYESNSDSTQEGKYIKVNASIDYDDTGDTPYINLVSNTSNINSTTYEKVSFESCQVKPFDTGSVSLINDPEGTPQTWYNTIDDEGYYEQFASNSGPWQTRPKFIDGDYTTCGSLTDYSGPDPLEIICEKVSGATASVPDKTRDGAIFKLAVPDDFDFNDYDNVYLGWGMAWFNGLTRDDQTDQNEYKFHFDTLNVAYDHSISVSHNNLWSADTTSDVESKFILPPSNRLSMEMTKLEGETGLEERVATQLYDDGTIKDSVELLSQNSKVIFSPFAKDNSTAVGKLVFGEQFKIGYDAETDKDDSYIEEDQTLKSNMAFTNDPVVTDANGNKFIYLYPRIDVFDYDTEGHPEDIKYRLAYRIQELHLICEKSVSSDKLYVKVVGETLPDNTTPVTNVYQAYKLMLEKYNNFTDINYTNVEATRSNWDVANIISTPTSSKILLKELASQSMVGIYTNREGNIELDAFFEDVLFDDVGGAYWADASTNPDKGFWIHDNDTIIKDSIKNVNTTSSSKVYNDINLEYNKDYASNSYTKSYFVTKVDEDSFPLVTSTRNYKGFWGPVAHGVWAVEGASPGVATKLRLSSFNLDGTDEYSDYDSIDIDDSVTLTTDTGETFTYSIASKLYEDYNGYFEYDVRIEYVSTTDVVNVGTPTTVYLSGDYALYSNIPSYTDARAFWENAHSTYTRNKVVKSITTTLAECDWYRDKFEFDGVGSVMNSSIHFYMESLIQWVTKAKNKIKYSIPINKENITIDLLDRVTFNDILITDGNNIIGWVTSKSIDDIGSKIDIEITTIPAYLIPIYKVIDEMPDNVDGTIDEQGTADSEVDEDFVMWL